MPRGIRPQTAVRGAGLVLGPVAAFCLWRLVEIEAPPGAASSATAEMAAVAAWMVIWWLSAAVPIAWTALLPLALFPLLAIDPLGETAAAYVDRLVFLFLGGFLIATAVETSGLHRRIALSIVAAVGDTPRRIVLGFMLATALLSMWMSNTATTLMLLPMAMSVIRQVEERESDPVRVRRFSIALLLGLAYGANIGGFATLIGTPTNVAFRQLYEAKFPAAPEISFSGWMALATPLAALLLVITWAMLTLVLFRIDNRTFFGGQSAVRDALVRLGPVQSAEKRVAAVFVATALLWILREPTEGWGWEPLLRPLVGNVGRRLWPNETNFADDTTVAVLMAALCLLIPGQGLTGRPLLAWRDLQRIPWGVLILFGGGLALASGMKATRLDHVGGLWLGDYLAGRPTWVVVAIATAGLNVMTEVATNVAIVQMSMPLLGEAAALVPCDPRLLMVPATIAASCAFMLPIATPPNAIVYGARRMEMHHMALAGAALNVVSTLLIVAFVMALGGLTLGISLDGPPAWAAPSQSLQPAQPPARTS